jgi:hypothetical protein
MGIRNVFGSIKNALSSTIGKVFGGGQVRSDLPGIIDEEGVNFNYPVIFVPGPPNNNALRNRDINDAALPFTPEEYKKIKNEIESRQDLNPYVKQEMFREIIKSNPKWVPNVNNEPKEKLNPSSSAIRSLRITPENKIKIRFANGDTEYTYTGGNTVRDAAKSVLDLINSPSIGKALNRKVAGSWAMRHYDPSAAG